MFEIIYASPHAWLVLFIIVVAAALVMSIGEPRYTVESVKDRDKAFAEMEAIRYDFRLVYCHKDMVPEAIRFIRAAVPNSTVGDARLLIKRSPSTLLKGVHIREITRVIKISEKMFPGKSDLIKFEVVCCNSGATSDSNIWLGEY